MSHNIFTMQRGPMAIPALCHPLPSSHRLPEGFRPPKPTENGLESTELEKMVIQTIP